MSLAVTRNTRTPGLCENCDPQRGAGLEAEFDNFLEGANEMRLEALAYAHQQELQDAILDILPSMGLVIQDARVRRD